MATEHSMAKKWAAILPFTIPSQFSSSSLDIFVFSMTPLMLLEKTRKKLNQQGVVAPTCSKIDNLMQLVPLVNLHFKS